jgi:hypothetical protein
MFACIDAFRKMFDKEDDLKQDAVERCRFPLKQLLEVVSNVSGKLSTFGERFLVPFRML